MDLFLQILIVIVAFIVNGWLSIQMYHSNNRRLEKRFLRHVRITHPETLIVISAVESTDRQALKKIKEQLDAIS